MRHRAPQAPDGWDQMATKLQGWGDEGVGSTAIGITSFPDRCILGTETALAGADGKDPADDPLATSRVDRPG
jgi:hypothetical protein